MAPDSRIVTSPSSSAGTRPIGMDLAVFRRAHFGVAELVELDVVRQAQFFEQPHGADGAGVGRVVNFHGHVSGLS